MPDMLIGADGVPLPGYLNDSAGHAKPALIVAHEWWGLNQHIRSVADRFAAEGFVTFAPDLYRGEVATDAARAETLADSLDWVGVRRDIAAIVGALRSRAPAAKVGILGFCLGGAVALTEASHLPELAACVPFYGIGSPDVSKIQGKVLGHFAKLDEYVSGERIDALEQALRRSGASATLHRYDCHHAFFNDSRPEVYSSRDAQLAWERTLSFLRETLT